MQDTGLRPMYSASEKFLLAVVSCGGCRDCRASNEHDAYSNGLRVLLCVLSLGGMQQTCSSPLPSLPLSLLNLHRRIKKKTQKQRETFCRSGAKTADDLWFVDVHIGQTHGVRNNK